MEAVGRVLVPVAGGQKQISLSQLAEVSVASGPAMIRDEDGLLTGYVYVDIAGQDPGGYIEEADRCSAKSWSCRPATRSPGAGSTRPCSGSGSA